MGNMQCPAEDAAHLASVARNICPFPNYNPNPLFTNMLSINPSLHLRNHYKAVQSSLTSKQLEDFTLGLRTTFGREGKVTLGGVGVVALSLAVLFDTLAEQVRGKPVSDSGLIPGLFLKDLRGYYPPPVYTISKYLRLVPHIANNPIRMREETERYITLLQTDVQSLVDLEENTLPLKEDKKKGEQEVEGSKEDDEQQKPVSSPSGDSSAMRIFTTTLWHIIGTLESILLIYSHYVISSSASSSTGGSRGLMKIPLLFIIETLEFLTDRRSYPETHLHQPFPPYQSLLPHPGQQWRSILCALRHTEIGGPQQPGEGRTDEDPVLFINRMCKVFVDRPE
ncbi:hypothetical protein Q8A73_015203 [Channa argus]|nr:hypothetical protein Q8A73_015203 [Channa argus]